MRACACVNRSVPRYLSDNDELEPDLGNGTEALGNTDLVPHQSDNDHESTEVPTSMAQGGKWKIN